MLDAAIGADALFLAPPAPIGIGSSEIDQRADAVAIEEASEEADIGLRRARRLFWLDPMEIIEDIAKRSHQRAKTRWIQLKLKLSFPAEQSEGKGTQPVRVGALNDSLAFADANALGSRFRGNDNVLLGPFERPMFYSSKPSSVFSIRTRGTPTPDGVISRKCSTSR